MMFEDFGFRLKLFGLQALHLLLIMILGVTGLVGMARIKGEFKAAHQDRTLALVYLSGALDDVHRIGALVERAAASDDPDAVRALPAAVAGLETERNHLWVEYIGTNMPPDEQAIAFRSAGAWNAYRTSVAAALAASGPEASAAPRLHEAADHLTRTRAALRELIDLQKGAASQGYRAADALFIKLGLFDLLLVCFGCGIACLLFFWDYVRLRRRAPVDARSRDQAPAPVTVGNAQVVR